MENRYVNFIYLGSFALLAVIFTKTVNLIWAVAELPSIDIVQGQLPLGTLIGVLLGLITTIILYKNHDVHAYFSQVVAELKEVDWPSWKDTQKSTVIVIAFAFILGAYLFAIDKIWSLLTNYILVS